MKLEDNVVYYVGDIDTLSIDNTELTKSQKDRYDTFSSPLRQKEYQKIYGALNRLLSDYLGIPISQLPFMTTELGKPYLEGNPVYFSLSHSRKCVCFAFSNTPIGVDLEINRAVSNGTKLLEKILSPTDLQICLDKPFLETWTKIESFVKCLGLSVFNLKQMSLFSVYPMEFENKLFIQRNIQHQNSTISFTKQVDKNQTIELDYLEII